MPAAPHPLVVVGAGAMGAGIAQIAATAGHPVQVYDVRAGAAEQAVDGIGKIFEKLVAKGRMPASEAAAASARLSAIASLEPIAHAGIVIEAIVEDLEAKRTLFRRVESRVSDSCLLATNTSSLSIAAIAAALRRPQRFAGMHFFNPAPLMALVEVVGGPATDPAVLDAIAGFARAWGKTPVRARNSPGFIVNRVARPFYGEGLRLVAEHAASPATIDAVLREAGGFRMGPLELTDLIGQDVNFATTRGVFAGFFYDSRFAPSLVQQDLVEAGWLGRKTGRGFYDYSPGAPAPAPEDAPSAPLPRRLPLVGQDPVTNALAARLEGAGVEVVRDPHLPADMVLRVTDGRTAAALEADAAVGGRPQPTAVVDLALDYASAKRTALAFSPACGAQARTAAIGALQAAGLAVSVFRDLPGLAVLRTVAMLANEAADAVHFGVASAADVDTAMRLGVNYPLGPLEWAARLGVDRVAAALGHLHAFYGEPRYRVSPGLRHG